MTSPVLVVVLGGVLREGGHKTWVAWAIVGVAVIVGIAMRIYRGCSR
jgi:hypothetical protein